MIFSIINQKGGVGKTTTALNLAYGLAQEDYKVLMIDADAQSNLTQSIGYDTDVKPNLYTLFKDIAEKETPDTQAAIIQQDGPHLLPASPALKNAALEFSGVPRRENMLKKILKPIEDDYDLIIIDCPPAFGFTVQNIITVSDQVIIPVLAEALPVKGIDLLIQSIQEFAEEMEKEISIGGILFCQYNTDTRTILSRDLYDGVKDAHAEIIFNTTIRRNISLSEAQLMGQPVYEYAPESNGAKDYKAFTKEFIERFT